MGMMVPVPTGPKLGRDQKQLVPLISNRKGISLSRVRRDRGFFIPIPAVSHMIETRRDPVPAKYYFGIFDAVSTFCEHNISRL